MPKCASANAHFGRAAPRRNVAAMQDWGPCDCEWLGPLTHVLLMASETWLMVLSVRPINKWERAEA